MFLFLLVFQLNIFSQPKSKLLPTEIVDAIKSEEWININSSDKRWDDFMSGSSDSTYSKFLDENWVIVKNSNDIRLFSKFMESNPKSIHIKELKKAVNKCLATVVNLAVKEGYKLQKNQKVIKKFNINMSYTVMISGGYMDAKEKNIAIFSNPFNELIISGNQKLGGQGVIITEDSVYSFGI
jgi:hypothetical protein